MKKEITERIWEKEPERTGIKDAIQMIATMQDVAAALVYL